MSPSANFKKSASPYIHVCIDPQTEFCDPDGIKGNDDTENATQNIITLKSEFDALGIPTIWVYWKDGKTPDDSGGGFYKVAPKDGEEIAWKTTHSVFESGNFGDILNKGHPSPTPHQFLVTGFNTTACVYFSVLDMLEKGHNVTLITDCTANGNTTSKRHERRYKARVAEMWREGAQFNFANDIIDRLKQEKAQAPFSKSPL